MGDWPRLVNLRRCARGMISDTGEATNTTVALTNNSLGPELILVWQTLTAQSSSEPGAVSYQRGLALTPGGIVQPVVPGDAPPPGVLSSGDLAVAFTPDWILPSAAIAYQWPATFPFAVLQPGWSLVVQELLTPTGDMTVQFFWEAILSKYFDRVHTMAQLELDLIAQSGG